MTKIAYFFRSVEPAQRSLALGFQTMLIRALGTVPGPIVYGAVIDKTCILWQGQDEGGDISCRVFDNTSTSRHLLVSSDCSFQALEMTRSHWLLPKRAAEPRCSPPYPYPLSIEIYDVIVTFVISYYCRCFDHCTINNNRPVEE